MQLHNSLVHVIYVNIRGKTPHNRCVCNMNLPMARAATNLIGMTGDPQYGKKVAMYSPKVRQIMPMEEVRTTMTEVQANRKAGMSPKASLI